MTKFSVGHTLHSSPAAHMPPSITTLPNEILCAVLIHINDRKSLYRCRYLCRRFVAIIADPEFMASWLVRRHGKYNALGATTLTDIGINAAWKLTDKCVVALIQRGGNPHMVRDLPLVWAATRGFEETFARLVKLYNPLGRPAENMVWASSLLNTYCTAYSMKKYPYSLYNDPTDTDRPSSPLDMALQGACSTGRIAIVRMILALDPKFHLNINSASCFALRVSTAAGHISIVRLLLAANVHLHSDVLPTCLDISQYQSSGSPDFKTRLALLQVLSAAGASFTGGYVQLHMLESLYLRGIYTLWPFLQPLIADNHLRPTDLAVLATRLLSNAEHHQAVALLALVPRPLPPLLHHMTQIVSWLIDPTKPLSPDLALAHVLPLHYHWTPILLKILLSHPSLEKKGRAKNPFHLPWCFQMAYSSGLSHNTTAILTDYGLTKAAADAVFSSRASLLIARADYLSAVHPEADVCTGLEHVLCNRIAVGDVRAVRLLAGIGADDSEGVARYLRLHWEEPLVDLDGLRRHGLMKTERGEVGERHVVRSQVRTRSMARRRVLDPAAKLFSPDPGLLCALIDVPSCRVRVVRVLARLHTSTVVGLFEARVVEVERWGWAVLAAAADA
ncbi:hypothetical protein BC936DRAFT_137505, partial [Jimgerdemannia flammicorona]